MGSHCMATMFWYVKGSTTAREKKDDETKQKLEQKNGVLKL